MSDLHLLAPDAAAAALREAGAGARGFLGLDPIVQDDALLARELELLDARVYLRGSAVLGFALNAAQPRQAYVASSSTDPEPLRAFLAFLGSSRRCTSYVAHLPHGAESTAAFEDCGFRHLGTLRAHRFESGAYRNVRVYYADGAGPFVTVRHFTKADLPARAGLLPEGRLPANPAGCAVIPGDDAPAPDPPYTAREAHRVKRILTLCGPQGQTVGFAWVTAFDWRSQTCELSFGVLPEHRGVLGLVAIEAVRAHVRTELNLEVIVHQGLREPPARRREPAERSRARSRRTA